MKNLKSILVAAVLLVMTSCSTDDVSSDNGNGNTDTVLTANGQTVSTNTINADWLLTSRSNGTDIPCGESEVLTRVQLNDNGTVTRSYRGGGNCQTVQVTGTYTLSDTGLLRINAGGVEEYELYSLSNGSMTMYSVSSDVELNYEPLNGDNTSSVFEGTEFIMGDWVAVAVMINNVPQPYDVFKCGERFESLTFNNYNNPDNVNPTGNGTMSLFKKNDACPNATDENNIGYLLQTFQADTDGYQWNDLKLTYQTSAGDVVFFINEISFEDDNETIAESLTVTQYLNGNTVQFTYERP